MIKEDGQLDLTADSKSVRKQKQTWEKFRKSCALVYPNSPYAIEERVIDSWNYLVSKVENSDIPRAIWRGGMKIKLYDEYAMYQGELVPRAESVSDDAYSVYEKLHRGCNPFNPTRRGISLDKVIGSMKSASDVRTLLPEMMRRWRWVSMGNLGYTQPDKSQSDTLINLCCKFDQPEVALHLLRYRQAYKLSPTHASLDTLMTKLAERYLRIASNPENVKSPPTPEPEPSQPAMKRRRASYKDFPFRQGPRLYFYKPIPFVLDPEPSVYAEFALPSLPSDNETRRLLPDDQRKRLKLMLDEEQRKQDYADIPRESAADAALTDLYRLFHYTTSQNPRYYGMKATSHMRDTVLLAGTLGLTEEGKKRTLMAGAEFVEKPNTISLGGLSGYFAALSANGDTKQAAENFDIWINGAHQKDHFGVSSLSGLYAAHLVLSNSPSEAMRMLTTAFTEDMETETVSTFVRDQFMSQSGEVMANLLKVAAETDHTTFDTVKNALLTSPNTKSLVNHPGVISVLQ